MLRSDLDLGALGEPERSDYLERGQPLTIPMLDFGPNVARSDF